jgi:NAD(P)-dependent dehydrogenase (short-subunit alcohol dehydrogenase family)
VALITGGAGLYGRQIVAALAEAGAQTYTAARHLDALEQVAAEERARGYDVTALALDQSDEKSIFILRDKILRRSGRIDILVNNAVARPMTKGYTDDAATFDESMRVNATGLFMITRAIGDAMADGGSMIHIGSIMGLIGPEPANYRGTEMHGWYPDYFFHKGGMVNFTRFAASYYGSRAIRSNCIHPGGLQTNQPEAFVRQYNERTCLGRMANRTDLMGVIVFLASDASLYITGANIPVDGGYTAK